MNERPNERKICVGCGLASEWEKESERWAVRSSRPIVGSCHADNAEHLSFTLAVVDTSIVEGTEKPLKNLIPKRKEKTDSEQEDFLVELTRLENDKVRKLIESSNSSQSA